MYKKHLEVATGGGFPTFKSDIANQDPIVLPEMSDVLDILFRFIRPPIEAEDYQQPSLFDLDPQLAFKVAEAAQKYLVYGAMNMSKTYMMYVNTSL